jgi:galactokinase
MDQQERRKLLDGEFRQKFGTAPDHWVRAPGRVDLMGSHTDYNAGTILTVAIDRDTWIAARAREDTMVNLVSINMGESATFDLGDRGNLLTGSWALYVQAVAIVLREEGHVLHGFDAVIHGTVPLSSGLSSSAALEVATATLFDHLCGLSLDPLTIARIGQRAENEVVGVSCGILDQYSSAMGRRQGALLLDCRSLTHEVVDLPNTISVVICNTCAPRNLKGSKFDERRRQCEEGAAAIAARFPGVETLRDASLEQLAAVAGELSPEAEKRSRFIIEEIARVTSMAEALAADNRDAIRDLTAQSYLGARDLFEIGAPVMEHMMEAMLTAPGVIGARQSGAGFGGCMVAFVDKAAEGDFVAHVMSDYRQRSGLTPETYVVQAAEGAGLIG